MEPRDLMQDYHDILQSISSGLENFKDYTMVREGHFIILSKDGISFMISVVTFPDDGEDTGE